jgi:hypothetical protein
MQHLLSHWPVWPDLAYLNATLPTSRAIELIWINPAYRRHPAAGPASGINRVDHPTVSLHFDYVHPQDFLTPCRNQRG